SELAGGSLRLGEVLRDVMLVKEDLALKVMRFDEIAVDQAQMSDAGPHKGVGQHRPQGAATAQRDMGVHEFALAGLGNAIKAHLPAVAFQRWIIGHGSSAQRTSWSVSRCLTSHAVFL